MCYYSNAHYIPIFFQTILIQRQHHVTVGYLPYVFSGISILNVLTRKALTIRLAGGYYETVAAGG